jgi:hypothetical protein
LFGSSDVWKEDQKILAITSHVSWTKKKQMYLRKQKNLNFIEVWWVQHWLSWVGVEIHGCGTNVSVRVTTRDTSLLLVRVAPDLPPVEFSLTHFPSVDVVFSYTDFPPSSYEVVLTFSLLHPLPYLYSQVQLWPLYFKSFYKNVQEEQEVVKFSWCDTPWQGENRNTYYPDKVICLCECEDRSVNLTLTTFVNFQILSWQLSSTNTPL